MTCGVGGNMSTVQQWSDLCTELEINHYDADLRAGHHQDDEDQKQEAKQVIELILPDGL